MIFSSLRVKSYGYVGLSVLATICQSTPIPQDVRVIGPSTGSAVCGMSASDSSGTWRNSGASALLDKFIKDNGPLQWSNKIGQQKLADGRPIDSTIDCADLSGNCPAPGNCLDYNPPALFHVQSAMSNAHRILKGYENELQSAVIEEMLKLSTLVDDFGEPEQEEKKVLEILNGAFSIASGVFAGVAPVSGVLSVISATFGLAASLKPENEPVDVRPGVEQLLAQIFRQARDDIAGLTSTIFGGQQDTAVLTRISPPANNAEETDIGKFFGNGRYLIPASFSLDTEIRGMVDLGMRRTRQALVIRALKTRGFFVWIDKFLEKPEDCKPTGSRFFDGKCYQLVKPTTFGNGFEPIDAETVLKFDNPANGYHFDMEEFYRNSEDCYHGADSQGLGGEVQKDDFPLDGRSLPRCFFNIVTHVGFQSPLLCGTVPPSPRPCFNQPPVRGT